VTEASAEEVDQPEPRVPRRPAEIICGAWLTGAMLLPLVLLGLTPSLLAHHVVILEMLSSGAVSIVTAAAMAKVGAMPLALAVLAPLGGLLVYDLVFWWAGRLWGDAFIGFLTANQPRARRWVGRFEGWVAHHGVIVLSLAYVVPVPRSLVFAVCGASGMRLVVFILGDLIGLGLWTAVWSTLGWQLGQGAVDVVHTIDHYSLRITIALVVVIIAVSILRQKRAAAAVSSP
jgi:membrane protein DedA with SNARE-associated domain